LAGDATDGIPGVKGVGLKTAARIIRDNGSVEALWARHDAGEAIKGVALQRAAGQECRADYFRNLKLIDWRLAPPLRDDFELELREPEFAAFAKLCGEWGQSGADEVRRRFSVPGKDAHGIIAHVRDILSRAASASDRITPAQTA
jgi:5'-3' exonuclease